MENINKTLANLVWHNANEIPSEDCVVLVREADPSVRSIRWHIATYFHGEFAYGDLDLNRLSEVSPTVVWAALPR